MAEIFTRELEKDSKKRINGVKKYLRGLGYHPSKHQKIVNDFLKTIETDDIQDTFRRQCKIVQKHFGQFVRWINTK